jgi:hypothetical protein
MMVEDTREPPPFEVLDLEHLGCVRPAESQSVICGQSVYGELGGGDEWLGYRPMGHSVTVNAIEDAPPASTPASTAPPWRPRVFRGPITHDGRFEVRVPFRASAVRVCIDGFSNGNVSPSDRCHEVPLLHGGASISIDCNLWPYRMRWVVGYPAPLD